MELEFDKEMDAMLRKARDGEGAAANAVATPHADADAIAAFAENALPARSRQLYVQHFADCDRCRKMLSQTILSNAETIPAATPAAVEKTAPAIRPWYEILFRPQNLAVALGALVVAFTGLIGFLAYQSRNGSQTTDVAQVSEQRSRVASPSSAANASANTSTGNAADVASNTAAASNADPEPLATVIPQPMRSGGPSPGSPDAAMPTDTKQSADKSAGASAETEAKPVAAAPPPPPVAGAQPSSPENARKPEPAKLKDDSSSDALAKSDTSASGRNERSLSNNVANRVGGPRNVQVQQQQQSGVVMDGMSMSPPPRRVGGRTFEHRDGVWYDTAYHGAATKNYRRGTDEYAKLDNGLRSIADSIGGTVVIVWKKAAYRIQ